MGYSKAPIGKVYVPIKNLNIRKGPGFKFDRIGKFTGIGEFEIIKKTKTTDSEKGWAKLKSGQGWINLDFCEEIE